PRCPPPAPCAAAVESLQLSLRDQTPPRLGARACQRAARPHDVEYHHGERHRVGGPHVEGIPAHVEELFHARTTSRIQLALRSRPRISPRSRTRSSATKNSVKPSSIISSGTSIVAGMWGLPSCITDGAWWSEFHQVTE